MSTANIQLLKEQSLLKVELTELINLISNALNTFTSALFLIDEENEQIHLTAIQSLSNNITSNLSIGLGDGMIGWVAQNQKPLNVAKYRWDNKHFQMYRKDEGINSFLAVPVMEKGKIAGVLCVDSKKQYVFTTKLQKIIQGFAAQVSIILRRYETLRKEKIRAEYFEQLFYFCRELSKFKEDGEFYNTIINLAREILYADFCILTILDKTKNAWKIRAGNGYLSEFQRKKTFPLDHGLAGVVFKEDKPLLIESINVSNDRSFVFTRDEPKWMLKSYIGVKLLVKGEPIGLLHFISKKPNHFNQEDIDIAKNLAEQTSISMENNQIFQRVSDVNCLDQLTGLNNHTSCQEKIIAGIETASYLNPMALLLIDIDQFGQMNDRYGFEVGDHILRKLSAILVSIVKEKDFVARYDGDGFAIVLVDTRQKEAKVVADRIKQVIERSIFTMEDIEIKITLSVGIGICPMHAKTRALLSEAAVHALQMAKQSGGNTICTFQG